MRTIWLAVWTPPPEQTVEETLAGVASNAHLSAAQRISEQGTDPSEQRYANWYPERVDGREQWGLYAYTVRPGSCVQAAFVSDEESGLAWALEAWRSLRWMPGEGA